MSLSPSYQAALDTIYNYVDYERRRSVVYSETAWDLERARRVLSALGDPQSRYRIVHVAGSKGKGSTAAGIESILRAAGLRTGFFTSPHLHTFRERIRVDGRLIDRAAVVNLLERCLPAIESVPGITTFEIMTVLALQHFADQGVAWAVLEVGLGGRLDATNVVTPQVSVITRISLEHTALLGDTLAAIAREKAGIIKPGVPVIVGPQPAEALASILQAAEQRAAPATLVGADWTWQPVATTLAGQIFTVEDLRPGRAAAAAGPAGRRELTTPLLGPHQLANQTTAVAAAVELADQGVGIDEQAIRRGIAAVRWPARLEVLRAGDGASAAVVIDSAHTVESMVLFCDTLAELFPGRRLRAVVGVSNDKDAQALLAVLVSRGAALYLTRSRHPRALDGQALAAIARQLAGANVAAVCPTARDALVGALADAGGDTVVCVAGSLFIAGECREVWHALHPDAFAPDDWVLEAEPMAPDWQVSQTAGGQQRV